MKSHRYRIRADVWLYPGDTPWHFVSVDKKTSHEIKEKYGRNRRGFSSLSVAVTLGKTKWKTSIFPDKKSGAYLLPLKADVRKKEEISVNDTIRFTIQIKV